ncbi:MAG: hydantoinase/oxoprolinase family protein [Promethearchaeota archaeon]
MNEENHFFILGLDIGGANTKAALLEADISNIIKTSSSIAYFPFWEKTLNDIPVMFSHITDALLTQYNLQLDEVKYFAITITCELSDAFQTKKEGINKTIDALTQIFPNNKLFFMSTDKIFISEKEARKNYLKVSASNWVSTALFLGKFNPNCILIDSGSTTIDIIPIKNEKPITKGKTDVDRLLHHELIYTGGLRATIPSITHEVPYKDKLIQISFEKFALVSDVHRILNNITESQYTTDTADNRTPSLEDCYSRLARIICADIDMLSIEDLRKIAEYIYEKQLSLIEVEIELFLNELEQREPDLVDKPKFIITGMSADYLIKPCLQKMGYNNIKSYEKLTKIYDKISSSAIAVAGALYYQIPDLRI